MEIVKPRRAMYGTSFSENVISYYLSRVTKVERQVKFDRWHYDMYLPDFSTVIEYDGWYFHKVRLKLDERKSQCLQDKGIKLIRIIEDRVEYNYVKGSNIYIKDGHLARSRFQFALDVLTGILGLPFVVVDWDKDFDEILKLSVKVQKSNELLKIPSEIIAEWDYEKNGEIKPESVSAGSHYSVWWKCKEGHSYRLAPCLRVSQGQGCPYCASKKILPGYNDLASRSPAIAKEWHPDLNNGVSPSDVSYGSNKKAYWKCSVCGHVWAAKITNRTCLNRGCPECGRKKITGRPRKHSLSL